MKTLKIYLVGYKIGCNAHIFQFKHKNKMKKFMKKITYKYDCATAIMQFNKKIRRDKPNEIHNKRRRRN